MVDRMLRIARSVDQAVVRHANERAVLTEVALHPNLSAAAIAKRLNLGSQTVGRIVGDLVEKGLVSLGEAVVSGRGKPATPIHTTRDAAFAIGCEIGLEHSELVLLNIRGEVLGSHRWNYVIGEPAQLLKQVVSIVELLTNIVPNADRSRIAGLALVSPVNIAHQIRRMGVGEVLAGHWAAVDLAAELALATGLSVTPYNDGNAACWGELAKLQAPRPGRICYVLLSTFVIAGVVADGRLLEGKSADLGAMLMPDEHGRLAQLHSVAGLQALLEHPLASDAAIFGTDPLEWDWDALEPAVASWVDSAGKTLAVAVVSAAAIAGCEMAIIDATLPRSVTERLVASVSANLITMPSPPLVVQEGRAGFSAPARGGAMLLLYRGFFSGEWEHFDL
jgi:predicted NBD/HSP70 family sugar kinase